MRTVATARIGTARRLGTPLRVATALFVGALAVTTSSLAPLAPSSAHAHIVASSDSGVCASPKKWPSSCTTVFSRSPRPSVQPSGGQIAHPHCSSFSSMSASKISPVRVENHVVVSANAIAS